MFIQQKIDYETFVNWVLKAGNNYLLERIWRVLNDFFQPQHEGVSLPLSFYEQMRKALEERNMSKVLALFAEYMKQS